MQQKKWNLPTTPTVAPRRIRKLDKSDIPTDCWPEDRGRWRLTTPCGGYSWRRWRIERGLITPLLCDLLLERKTLISDFDGQWKRDSKWLTGTKANIPFPLACLPMTHRCLPGSSKSRRAQNSKAEKPFLSVSGTTFPSHEMSDWLHFS